MKKARGQNEMSFLNNANCQQPQLLPGDVDGLKTL